MTKTTFLFLASTLLLTACQTTTPTMPPPDTSTRYKAIGTEPFWVLTIENGTMLFDDSGEVTAKADSYTARPSINGWRYVAKELTADVTFEECSDGMSEFTYKDSVTVMVGERTYKGCGGGRLPPDDFEGTSWRVNKINGADVGLERQAFFEFAKGRFSGTIGCNRMSGSFSYKDKKLTFGPMMSTRMGCPDPIGAQEMAFAAVLGSIASMAFPGDGSVVLTGKDGATVVMDQMM
jgi:heat shock protein HslJ